MKFFDQRAEKRHVNSQPVHRSEQGQVVVEYVLLLMVGVLIAFMLSNFMVSRSPSSTGFLIAKWYRIIVAIGADQADDTRKE